MAKKKKVNSEIKKEIEIKKDVEIKKEDKKIIPNKYIVKKDDTIYTIAKEFNLKWINIYERNREIIDKEAIKHGRYINPFNYLYEGTILYLGE